MRYMGCSEDHDKVWGKNDKITILPLRLNKSLTDSDLSLKDLELHIYDIWDILRTITGSGVRMKKLPFCPYG